MKTSSLTIFSFKEIPVRLHWSFILFLVWIGLNDPGNLKDSLLEVVFVATIFGCVVLHEFGHALTAKVFGIRTRDITLYPIGGVALLEKEARPAQELLIAIAGPLVNVIIALLIYILVPTDLTAVTDDNITFIQRLFLVNIILVLFNMIPAYPMDGGRVLRSTLGLFFNQGTATIISGRIGQVISIGLCGFAFYMGNPILVFIAVFVFLKARDEIKYWKRRRAAEILFTNGDTVQ